MYAIWLHIERSTRVVSLCSSARAACIFLSILKPVVNQFPGNGQFFGYLRQVVAAEPPAF